MEVFSAAPGLTYFAIVWFAPATPEPATREALLSETASTAAIVANKSLG